MDEETLGYVLDVPDTKRDELQEQSVEGDYRRQLITHYLQSSPHASWEHIGGWLLFYEEDSALHSVKQFLQTQEGNHVFSTDLM